MKPKVYEGMFILHPAEVAKDYDKAVEAVKEFVTRAGGKILDCRKWDDRRLCYDIKHQKRGIYMLVHFEGTGPIANEINRRSQMSELVLRSMIVVDQDGIPQEELGKEPQIIVPSPAPEGTAPAEPAAAIEPQKIAESADFRPETE